MRTLRFALAAVAAFAFDANAQSITGMGNPPTGVYQDVIITGSGAQDGIGFHAGGVAACDGCHVMHNASSGVAKSTAAKPGSVAPWSNVTNMYLLQGGDQSSTCLICHSGVKSGASNQFFVADLGGGTPSNRTPGGDFGWLLFDWTNSPGVRHGHNIAAVDFAVIPSDPLKIAPGGAYTGGVGKAAFACSSCHDPHGRYRMQIGTTGNLVKFTGPFPGSDATLPIAASGSYGQEPSATYAVGTYRLLAGRGYVPASNNTAPFTNDPPVAVAPQTYNSGESSAEVRVAYGTGMSEWCQNCHTNIHLDGYTTGQSGLRHPAGSDAFLHTGQIDVYNTYISSGRVNTTFVDNYTSLVPFEQGKSKTLAALVAKTTGGAIAADTDSTVMCLSCHRAHGSAFDSMVRWDQNATFLSNGTAFTAGLTNRTGPQTTAGYYDREVGSGGKGTTNIGPYQRSLCNKCHGKD